MNAKDWLEKEGMFDVDINGGWNSSFNLSTLLERYSNYKNKELFGQIFQYRAKLASDAFNKKKELLDKSFHDSFEELFILGNCKINSTELQKSLKECDSQLNEFDEYFGIKEVSVGRLS